MKLKDLNQQFALEQLREKCKSYQQYRIENYDDSNQIEYMDYDLSDKTIEYLVFGIRDAVPDQFAVYLNFTNKSYAQELLEHLDEARKAIESRQLVDDNILEAIDQAIEYAENALELDDEESLLFVCDTIFNFDEDDDDLSKVQVVSIPMEHVDSEYEEFRDELRNHLTRLKEALESALSASQELGEPQLTNALTESLSVCEELYKYFADQLMNVDVNSFTQQEFEICEIEIDDEEVAKYKSEYNQPVAVSWKPYYYDDPIQKNEFLERPRRCIRRLEELLNVTLLKRLNKSNQDLPNALPVSKVKEDFFWYLSGTSNAIKRALTSELNSRIPSAKESSKEEQVIKLFEESTKHLIDKMFSLHEELQPYIKSTFQGSPPKKISQALTEDADNGTNQARLRVLSELQDLTNQLSSAADTYIAAYQDMLQQVHTLKENNKS